MFLDKHGEIGGEQHLNMNLMNGIIHRLIVRTKLAYTKVDPVKYDDDDVFGYMRAESEGKGKDKVDLTVTRLSPLKCSPLISISPQIPTDDWGVMARQEGDPVPYVHQFYSCVLQGIFSLNLDAVGTFSAINRTGYIKYS